MEPNGVQAGQQQGSQAPAQNNGQPPAQQPAQNQAPSTPQFNILPVNQQTGRVDSPPAQATQQQTQADQFNAFRAAVAASIGVQVNEVPSDPGELSKVVAGGYAAAQRLRAWEQQQGQPKPQVQQDQAANPLQPKAMAPGWDRMVQKNAQGVYEPLHPNFASVAADANYNEGVFAQRNLALNQGQMLPEQTATVKELVQQQLAAEREELKANMFMEANESKLYAMNSDGSPVMQVDPVTMKSVRVPSELGVEMRQAAQEILDSGAKYGSQHELAKYALKVAEGRIKMKQAQQGNSNGTTGNGPPSQVNQQYNGLADLLQSHKNTGNTGGGNLNTLPPPRPFEARADYRAALANMPDNLNGVDYLNSLFR